jgi:hypothetical protein
MTTHRCRLQLRYTALAAPLAVRQPGQASALVRLR